MNREDEVIRSTVETKEDVSLSLQRMGCQWIIQNRRSRAEGQLNGGKRIVDQSVEL